MDSFWHRIALAVLALDVVVVVLCVLKHMFPFVFLTLFVLLQIAFNSLRDNEQRGARHRQRTNHRLQALTISCIRTQYGLAPQIDVDASDIGRMSNMTIKADTFDPTSGGA
jgi:hypothetical protein